MEFSHVRVFSLIMIVENDTMWTQEHFAECLITAEIFGDGHDVAKLLLT